MFSTVLVANRGEIAVRIMRTLRAMGIRAAAAYSDADAGGRHVLEADVAFRLGPAPARLSYLAIERVIEAALAAKADALHPGYGFLAENAALAEACAANGIVFVGPPPAAIRAMGDKIRARHTVSAAGVPVVPGCDQPGLSDVALAAAALDVGLPVLVKPSAGGGGKGMRLVRDEAALATDIAAARREAANAFGDDALLVERFVARPRHIEVQVLADHHGNVVHLGERECSLQRRHQKIVEEAPSPLVTPELREAMGAQAVAAARACGYANAGTVELIVSGDRPDEFFFMEMNTRLQVEHPVTELVYGIDLVEQQLRIAAGEPLSWTQDEVVATGHAVEARVYAENPANGFLPTGGTVLRLREPSGPGVRVDSGLREGVEVGLEYDPMLAKVIAYAPDRRSALRTLDAALADTAVLGVTTNVGFLRTLLADDDVVAGRLDTGLVERRTEAGVADDLPPAVVATAALADVALHRSDDLWAGKAAWRLGEPGAVHRRFDVEAHGTVDASAHFVGGRWEVAVDGGEAKVVGLERDGGRLAVTYDGRVAAYDVVSAGRTTWVGHEGRTWAFTVADPWDVAVAGGDGAHGPIRSPMPGSLVAVLVAEGQDVVAGEPVAIVEAMKMEHTLRAPVDGRVVGVHAAAGAQLAMDDPVVTIGT